VIQSSKEVKKRSGSIKGAVQAATAAVAGAVGAVENMAKPVTQAM